MREKAEMIQATVTFAGVRINPKGEVWMRFEAANSMAQKVAPCLFMEAGKTVLHVVIEFAPGQKRYLGRSVYNGLVQSPQGGYIVGVRSVQSAFSMNTEGMIKTSFDVLLLAEQEWSDLMTQEKEELDDGTTAPATTETFDISV